MEQVVITSKDIQAKYIKLYKFLMQYLWDYSTVEALANLEIECFKAFPDKDFMLKYLRDLKYRIQSTYNELTKDDKPEFEDIFNQFEQYINDYDAEKAEIGLYYTHEPVELPESSDTKEDKVFKFGDIEKIESEDLDEEPEDLDEEPEDIDEESEDKLANPFEEE